MYYDVSKLSVYDVMVSQKVLMEKESNIFLGGTIILLILFAQNLIFEQRYEEKTACKFECEI